MTDVWLGVDQSYTGFGLTAIAMDGAYRTWVYKSDGQGLDRLIQIGDWLEARIDSLYAHQFWVKDVAMEGYAFSSQMAHMAGELGALVKLRLDNYNLRPWIVAPTSLKKFATGQGTKVTKSQILLAVYKHWGVEFNDDNAADSYVLARIAMHRGGVPIPMLGPASKIYNAQKAVLSKLEDDNSKCRA